MVRGRFSAWVVRPVVEAARPGPLRARGHSALVRVCLCVWPHALCVCVCVIEREDFSQERKERERESERERGFHSPKGSKTAKQNNRRG